MTIPLRKSPSGPVIAEIGNGFLISRAFATLIPTGGSYSMVQNADMFFGNGDPATDAQILAAPAAKAEHAYELEISAMFNASGIPGTSTLEIAVQYSNNAGVSWADMGRTNMNIPTSGTHPDSAGIFRARVINNLKTGADLLPPNVTQGELLFRALAVWRGSDTMRWQSAGTGAEPVGDTQLTLSERLAGV